MLGADEPAWSFLLEMTMISIDIDIDIVERDLESGSCRQARRKEPDSSPHF